MGQKSEADSQEHAIKVRVNEVLVPVTVLNSKGEMILDLSRDNFRIFDGDVEETIEHFDLGGESLAVALVVETSSHIQKMAPAIRKIGNIFTETVMAPEGRAALITYDSTVDIRQPFTTDHDAIESAMGKLEFDAPEIRLYDAMSTAVGLLKAQPPNFRRVMLIVGESQDQFSDAKLGLVLREVQLANISIYAVGPSSSTADLRYGGGTTRVPLPKSVPPTSTEQPSRNFLGETPFDLLTPAIWLLSRGTNEIKNHQLEVAVASTGGVHYRAIRDRDMQSALDKIGGEIHTQYMITYTPGADGPPGFHKIKVTVGTPNAVVRARPGYFIDFFR
jgi:VWFA-related protein